MARTLIVVLIGWLASGGLAAAGPGLSERLSIEIDRYALGQFWGAVVVRVGGEDVLRRGYGFEGRSLAPIDPGVSLFDVGSVAKSVTAVTVLGMGEDGLIGLEETLGEVFPGRDLGVFGGTSVGALLGHRWGLRDPGGAMRGADFSTSEGLLDVLRSAIRDGEAGVFSYSNFGYFVLAAAIRERSGMGFEDAARKWALGPAGLERAGFVGDGSVEGGRATARVSSRGGARSDVFGYPWNWGQRGATGVVMTADDAARWIERSVDPGSGLLGPASRAAMLSGGAGGYGLGWYVEEDADGLVKVSHGGATGGYRCEVAHWPGTKDGAGVGGGVTIVVLTNERWDAGEVVRRLARVVAPAPSKPSRAGVYLYRYEPAGGVIEAEGGLSWLVMPSYRGRGTDGEPIVEDRPTVVTVDSGVSMWTTMVMLDPEDALALADAAETAAGRAREAGGPDGMRMRFDVRGVELDGYKSVQLAAGSAWSIADEDGAVVARLTDAISGRVFVTARMSADEARSLAASLRSVAE